MADDYMKKTIKTEVEDIDCSVDPKYIQLDFNVDDPPEITDEPLQQRYLEIIDSERSRGPIIGNFKCVSCGMILPSKPEYDIHQQIHHSANSQSILNKRSLKSAINLQSSYDPECEDVDDPNYDPNPARRRNYKINPGFNKQKAIQAVSPLVNPMPITPRSNENFVKVAPIYNINPDKNYKCSKCFFSSENESLIREHMAKNKHAFKYQCNYCTKSFQFVYMLSNHHKSCHKDDEYFFAEFTTLSTKESDFFVCSLCPQREKNPVDIERHHQIMHSQSTRPFSYYVENLIAKAPKPTLMGNKTMYLPKTDITEPKLIKTSDNYHYSYGGRGGRRPRFSAQSDSMSSKSDVNELFYKCISCETWFNTLQDCKSHQEQYHESEEIPLYISTSEGGVKLNEKNLTKYICIRCSEEAYTTTEMKTHCKIHRNASQPLQYIRLISNDEPKLIEEATYKCSQCDVMPDTLMNMQQHWTQSHPNKVFKVMKLYADTPEKSFSCKHCSKIFKHSLMLDLHIRLRHPGNADDHEDDQSNSRQDHQPTYSSTQRYSPPIKAPYKYTTRTPIRPDIPPPKPPMAKTVDSPGKVLVEKYQCLYCSQAYPLFEKLREHHAGEHADFTWLFLYVRHMDNGSIDVISSGDKLYKCFYCDGDFGKNFSTLSIHYKEVHAPLQFKYKICEGVDGFFKWDVREHVLKLNTEPPKPVQPPPPPPREPTPPPPPVEDVKPDISKLPVLPPMPDHSSEQILPDIKPDVNYLNSLMQQDKEKKQKKNSKKRKKVDEDNEEAPQPKKTSSKKNRESPGSPASDDSETDDASWYGRTPKEYDLNRIVLMREFGSAMFKIAVSNISTVMNLQPKVKIKDYIKEKQKNSS